MANNNKTIYIAPPKPPYPVKVEFASLSDVVEAIDNIGFWQSLLSETAYDLYGGSDVAAQVAISGRVIRSLANAVFVRLEETVLEEKR